MGGSAAFRRGLPTADATCLGAVPPRPASRGALPPVDTRLVGEVLVKEPLVVTEPAGRAVARRGKVSVSVSGFRPLAERRFELRPAPSGP